MTETESGQDHSERLCQPWLVSLNTGSLENIESDAEGGRVDDWDGSDDSLLTPKTGSEAPEEPVEVRDPRK